MRRVLVFMTCMALILAVSLSAIAYGKPSPANYSTSDNHDSKIVAAVRALLDAQVAAWNRGDIDGFMDGYWRSPETVFVSGDTITHGWQTVLDRYKKGYDTREKMGTLTFSELEINVINKDTAVATGRWQLARAGDNPHGRFTLIFRKTSQGWRIVHDHTSSA